MTPVREGLEHPLQPPPERAGRHLLDGTLWVFLAEALLFPAGLLTAACLTRRLGTEGYGLFSLAALLVGWIEWTIVSLFARAAIRCVGATEDWRPIGARIVQLYLLAGSGAAFVLMLVAGPIAALLHEPDLAPYLRLFALEIPFFCLAQAHRNVLVGIGGFRQQALVSATRWTVKLLLIVLLVELGLSIEGAIVGCLGATVIEFAVVRCCVRPPLFARQPRAAGPLWGYAGPLFLLALCMRVYDKMDLLALKLLGGTTADVGIYSAAQNLVLAPAVFALSFSPLLVSSLSRLLRAGNDAGAREMARNSLRAIVAALPLAGMTAGAASEIVVLIFGAPFAPAAPVLAVLIFGTVGLVLLSVATAILTAAGKPLWAFAMVAPLLPLAAVGHIALIPRLGAPGAALVTALFAGVGALAMALAVFRAWRVLPPIATVCRSLLVSGLVYTLAAVWSTPGPVLFLKLSILGVVSIGAFLLLGELKADEMALVRLGLGRWLGRRRAVPEVLWSRNPPSFP
jgi:O-antigen/teichoic acid export membrane protein